MLSSPALRGEVLMFSPFGTMLAQVFMCALVLLRYSPSIFFFFLCVCMFFYHEGTLGTKTQLSPFKG